MDRTGIFILALILVPIVIGVYVIVYKKEMKGLKKEEKQPGNDNKALQLQVYERLVILTERISLRNLIDRVPPTGSAAEYQALLVHTIKHEFDYNLSQQLYVSSQAWQAVSSLKEQNIFILHQLAGILPPEASGLELAKKTLELLESDPKVSLHNIVLDTLKFDVTKLMNTA